MSTPSESSIAEALYSFVAHAKFAQAMSVVAISSAFGAFFLRQMVGQAGLSAILISEVILVSLILLARRRAINWSSFIPISLAAFIAWSALSFFWSYYAKVTLPAVAYQIGFAVLALAIAATRDSIQIIRAIGDVLRVFLGLSLILEVIAGVLIDSPIKFLGIQGNLVAGGGIQGIFGSRNALSIIAVIAILTFIIELRTNSVTKRLATWSLVIAILTLMFSASPVGWATITATGIVAAVLFGLRHLPEVYRTATQLVLALVVSLGFILTWVFRGAVIEWLTTSSVMQVRLTLWNEVIRISSMKFLAGWGWSGTWPKNTQPFGAMRGGIKSTLSSGLNAYLDVWLQVGLIGIVLLLFVLALAFIRSWSLASSKKSELYTWAPLVLTALLVSGLAESYMLIEWGWLLVVIIAAKSSSEASWRISKP